MTMVKAKFKCAFCGCVNGRQKIINYRGATYCPNYSNIYKLINDVVFACLNCQIKAGYNILVDVPSLMYWCW